MRKNKKMIGWMMLGSLSVIVITIIFLLGYPEIINSDDERNQTVSKKETENTVEETEATVEEQNEATEIADSKIMDKLSSMTLEEKVAQLFILTPSALTGTTIVTEAGETTKQALEQYPVCGLIYFDESIVDPEQLLEMTTNTQNFAYDINGLPLFLSTDEEGGDVARIGKNPNFNVEQYSNMKEIGKAGDVSQAYEVGAGIGKYLSSYGINLDFAPVADILTNPQNTVVEERSFGGDVDLTAKMAAAVARGLEEHQVFACLKHFPGHGATEGDTHNGYAYTNKTLEELQQEDLVSFQMGIDAGVSFVMVSHISVPAVVGDDTPSSLSEKMITEILRNDMGFQGIVITDAMNMGAIVKNYTAAEAAVKAIQAGVDIILMPEDFHLAYQGILDAVESGKLTEERINESVSRILNAKYRMENG